jgi:hypothetical protein
MFSASFNPYKTPVRNSVHILHGDLSLGKPCYPGRGLQALPNNPMD